MCTFLSRVGLQRDEDIGGRLGNKFAHLARELSICGGDLLGNTSICGED